MKIADTKAIQIKGTAEGGEGRQSKEQIRRLYKSRAPQREETGNKKESGRRGYAMQIKDTAEGGQGRQKRGQIKSLYKSWVPQRGATGDNNESECRGSTKEVCRRGRRRATRKMANTRAIQIKGTAEGGE